MKYYFVAKNPHGDFVGQLTLEEISRRFHTGEIPGNYVAAYAAGGSYSQLVQSGNATWVKVSDLISNPSLESKLCTNCGAMLEEDAKFCASCRTPIAKGGVLECPSCKQLLSADAKFCKYCAAELASTGNSRLGSPPNPYAGGSSQREKANRLAVSGAILGIVSAIAFFWGQSYTSNLANTARAGFRGLAGQTDSTYQLAQYCVTLGVIGFLVGLILFIVGLAQR